jgi:lysophospholipase L1-like esterase
LTNLFKNKVFNNISLKSYGDVTKEILFYEKRQEEFIKILEKAKNLTESNNSNFYLVYLPTHQRYLSNVGSIMHDFKFDIYPKIKKISKDLDLNFIDLHKDFLEKQENYNELLPLGIDGHFNINGYKKITEFIYNSIKKIN